MERATQNATWGRRLGRTVLAAVCLGALTTPLAAQTQSVTLAWDPTPASATAGYVVYVGAESGGYTEHFDVGNQTSFVYPGIVGGRPYYFAVAAYGSLSDAGPLSQEVFYFGGLIEQSAPAAGPESAGRAGSRSATGGSSDVQPRSVCIAANPDCYQLQRVATVAGNVSSLALTGDGRLFFIEDNQRVRVIVGDTLDPDPVTTVDADGSRFTGLVVDPAFTRTRFMYVSQTDVSADGRRELNIVRYRELQNTLGEGAVVVAGLPLPPSGDAQVAIDAAGRLYVAMPAAPDSGNMNRSPYAGMVLRFESDGTVPRDSRTGSPVFSRGYAEPTSLEWSAARNELWIAGSDAQLPGPLTRLPLDGMPQVAPDSSFVLSRATGAADALSLFRVSLNPGVSFTADQVSTTDLGGQPTGVMVSGSDVYLALASLDTAETPVMSQIIRLRPQAP